jgi:AraC-like DNA-binding protein
MDASDPRNENLAVRLVCPSNPEILDLLTRGAARRLSTCMGTARILRAIVMETFDQLNSVSPQSDRGLVSAVTALVWQALREQLETTSGSVQPDLQTAWAKRYIESRLSDPHLSVPEIARGCGMSVRSLHRAFADDSAGSVSRYVWTRRLDHCAAALRDSGQGHRLVTDICFEWGFNSSSHFSRAFKERFGMTPSAYRASLYENPRKLSHRRSAPITWPGARPVPRTVRAGSSHRTAIAGRC